MFLKRFVFGVLEKNILTGAIQQGNTVTRFLLREVPVLKMAQLKRLTAGFSSFSSCSCYAPELVLILYITCICISFYVPPTADVIWRRGHRLKKPGMNQRHLVYKVGVCKQIVNFSNENTFYQIHYNANDYHNRRMIRLKF